MGSGSSRGTAKLVVADTSLNAVNNNNIKSDNQMDAELREEPSHAAVGSEDRGVMDLPVTSARLNVKTVANYNGFTAKEGNIAVIAKDQNLLTQDTNSPSSSDLSSLLSSFRQKNPEMAAILNETKRYYEALKDALDSGNLSSKTTLYQVKGLFNVYFRDKTPKSRTILTEFAVAIGTPKLAYEMIVDRRNNMPELTTWDREIDEMLNKERILEEDCKTGISGETENLGDNKEKIDSLKMSQEVISQLLAAVLNLSDLNDLFSLACDEAGMVPLLVDVTRELQDSIPHNVKFVNLETQQLSTYTVRGKMLSRTMGILHNLSKRVPTRKNFAACQAVNVLIPLLKAEVILYAAKSLLVLAYLIDEENNHLIMADEGPIKFLTGLLKTALGMSNHRYLGFSAAEIAEGLTQIGVNDNNKKTIAQSGAIPILVTMLQKAQGDDESLNACNTLWTLAFDEDNKKEIKGNESAIPELQKLLSSNNSELRKAAAGALWECQGKEKHAEKKQLSVTVPEAADTKHVMISYQWDVQKSMIQLKTQLQAHGFKVWMDIDEMGGSTLESMARAVENAAVVLVGVSQKYKESPNCRSEAEYTYQLHKDIIPLMMDYKYKPDGWLGIIVGSKFWIDFSERHKLDANVEKLVKEIGNRGKMVAQETVQAATADVVDASPQTSIRSWTNSDVKKWLKEVGFESRLDSKAVQRLDGRMLLRLQDLRKESPEFFYSSIRTDFKLANVFDVLEFTDALDKLER